MPDPIDLPWQSPYCSMDNNPIAIVDPMGLLGGDPIETRLGGGGGKSSTPAAQQGAETNQEFAYAAGQVLFINKYGNAVPPPPTIDQNKLNNQGDYDASKYSFEYQQGDCEFCETGYGGYNYKVFYDGEYIGDISIAAGDFYEKPHLLEMYLKGEIDNSKVSLRVSMQTPGNPDPRLQAAVAASNYKAGMSNEELIGSSLLELAGGASKLASRIVKGGTNKSIANQTVNKTGGRNITYLTKGGKYPSWGTVKSRYWKIMNGGKVPTGMAKVRMRATGEIKIIKVSKELHHIDGRGGNDPHRFENLQEVWPWEHEAIDPSRKTGYEFLEWAK